MEALSKYVIDEGDVYELFEDGLFVGWRKVNPQPPKMKPYLSFKGPKIQMADWRQVLAFFKWANDDTKSEVQVRLYLNQAEGIWKPWAFPQEKGTGMTTREIEERCDNERQKAGLLKGWIIGGTVHSHCSSSAWQSSVDKDNEKTQHGIHITVGKLNDPDEYDIDGRVNCRGTFYKANYWNWFQVPDGLDALPDKFRSDVMKHFLTQPVTEKDEFPIAWKENVIEMSHKVVVYGDRKQGYGYLPYGNWVDRKDESKDDPKTEAGDSTVVGTGSPAIKRRRLSKREKKAQKRELRRLMRDGADPQKVTQDDETQALHRATVQTVNLCASLGMTTTELFQCDLIPDHELDPVQKQAVDEFMEIQTKENVDSDDIEGWLIQLEVSDEI